MAQNAPERRILRTARRRETKGGRFVRLAERRMSQTLHTLWLIGNLANRRNYEYTKGQADQLLAALDSGMRQVRARFSEETPSRSQAFRFKR